MQVNIFVNIKNMILQPSNRGFRSNRMSGSNPDRNELNIGEYENLRMCLGRKIVSIYEAQGRVYVYVKVTPEPDISRL